MPSGYSAKDKEDALELLRHGDSIAAIHFSTGIPERTLRHWRGQLRNDALATLAEKTYDSAIAGQQDCLSPTVDAAEPATESAADMTDAHKDDYADFAYIRDRLMTYAREMAANLRPDDPDTNRRTLALARILDRIQWLDEILPGRIPERVIRFEHVYDGQVHERPPWHGASEGFDRSLGYGYPAAYTEDSYSEAVPGPDDAENVESPRADFFA